MIYQTQLEAKIFETVISSIHAMGYDIVRLRFISQTKGEKILQFMIERLDAKGVTLKDCEIASRHLSVLLDVENLLDQEYKLELSSTGLNKPLTRSKDFKESVGSYVKIAVKMPINGQKKFTGKIIDFQDDVITLEVSSVSTVEIKLNNIVDAQVDYFASKTKKGDLKK